MSLDDPCENKAMVTIIARKLGGSGGLPQPHWNKPRSPPVRASGTLEIHPKPKANTHMNILFVRITPLGAPRFYQPTHINILHTFISRHSVTQSGRILTLMASAALSPP